MESTSEFRKSFILILGMVIVIFPRGNILLSPNLERFRIKASINIDTHARPVDLELLPRSAPYVCFFSQLLSSTRGFDLAVSDVLKHIVEGEEVAHKPAIIVLKLSVYIYHNLGMIRFLRVTARGVWRLNASVLLVLSAGLGTESARLGLLRVNELVWRWATYYVVWRKLSRLKSPPATASHNRPPPPLSARPPPRNCTVLF